MSGHRSRISVTIALLLASLARLGVAQCEGAWQPGLGGANWSDRVLASIVFDDGMGPALYVSGSLGAGGATPGPAVMKWSGSAWVGIGGPATVNDFEVWDDGTGLALYAAGSWPGIVGVRKLVGSTWVTVGSASFGFGEPRALALFDPAGPAPETLYVGGPFGVWQLSSGTWSPIGPSNTWDLCAYDADGVGPGVPLLVAGGVGGSFMGLGTNSMAGWNGTNWVSFGSGFLSISPLGTFAGQVLTVGAFDLGNGPVLIAGGGFNSAGGVSMSSLAQWDGATWSSIGNFDHYVRALTMFDDGTGPRLHVGGVFANAGGVPAKRFARLDPTSWTEVGGGVSSGDFAELHSFTQFDADGAGPLGPILIVSGTFMVAGTTVVDSVAAWTGTTWIPFGTSASMTGEVYAFAIYDDGTGPSVYAGGTFNAAGGVITNGIARFDGVSWVPVGPGMNDAVYALCVHDDGGGPQLYAGGTFTATPGQPGDRIAKWNGTSWSAVGGGISGSPFPSQLPAVCALLSFDDGFGPWLYAGGLFTNAGGTAVSNIARWDGQAWFDMGGGFVTPCQLQPCQLYGGVLPPGVVLALEAFDPDGNGPLVTNVVAGGRFRIGTGPWFYNVAYWDGNAWSPMGSLSGASSHTAVCALRSADVGGVHALYAAGGFEASPVIPGGPLKGIARWVTGPHWTDVGGMLAAGLGQDSHGFALASFDDGSGETLVVGGAFSSAGGVASQRVAKWNGSSWGSFGSGITGGYAVRAVIAPSPSIGMIAGGDFTHAGGLPSVNVAWWKPGSPFVSFTQPGGAGGGCFINNSNLQPGVEYWDIFSLEPCASLGTGPYLGLCATDPSFLVAQFFSPLGTEPFHFTAPGPSVSFGPFILPPGLVADAITFTLGPGPSCGSPTVRLVVQ